MENDDIKLEWAFKVAILKDIAMVRIMLTLSREKARLQMIRFPNVSTLKSYPTAQVVVINARFSSFLYLVSYSICIQGINHLIVFSPYT